MTAPDPVEPSLYALRMTQHPPVSQVEDEREYAQREKQHGGLPRPALHGPDASPQEVARQYHRRGPDGAPQGVVDEERRPAHAAHPGHQRAEDPQAGEKARHKYCPAAVTGEERFGAAETLRRDKDVASVAEYERAATFAADPVADLVPHHGA